MENTISYAVVDPNWGEPLVRLETIRSTKHETEVVAVSSRDLSLYSGAYEFNGEMAVKHGEWKSLEKNGYRISEVVVIPVLPFVAFGQLDTVEIKPANAVFVGDCAVIVMYYTNGRPDKLEVNKIPVWKNSTGVHMFYNKKYKTFEPLTEFGGERFVLRVDTTLIVDTE